MKIFHHSDLDGHSAAAIVLLKYPDAECIEVDYSTDIPFDRIEKDEEVIIVDFSFREDDWKKLWEITPEFTWIDHHETSIEKSKDVVLEVFHEDDGEDCELTVSGFSGLRNTSACGAMLTWRYFMGDYTIPSVIDLIDKWDRWVHNDDPEVLDFVAGMKIRDTSPRSETWQTLLGLDVHSETMRNYLVGIQRDGVTIRQYEFITNAEAVKRFAYPMGWEGYNCVVLHTDKSGSKQFDSVKGQYDITMPINFDGKKYTVHLYSEHVKVNDIALKFGGGGHPRAAGFVCENLPWQNPKL